MLEMEYSDGGDALTLANKNRVASKKIFEQLQQSARSSAHIALSEGHMLHRQPSGAQKRIRQRQEQKWLKAVSSNSNNVDRSRAPPPPVPEKSAYRSVIDSGGYKSILPDEPPFTVTAPSVTPLPKRNSSACSTQLPVTATFNNNANNTSSTITGGKPTVQVHPMPSSLPITTTTITTTNGSLVTVLSSSSSSSSSLTTLSASVNSTTSTNTVPEKIREKPAVPKKPAKLILSSTAASVEAVSVAPLSLSTSSLNLFSPSAQPSPSTSGSSFRLFSTPSFMCLHTALMQPSLSDEEVQRLDLKRLKLIESISRKVAILDEERTTIDEDFTVNEELKNYVFNDLKLSGDSIILEKIEKNLAQNSQLCRLETRLRMQLERLQSLSQGNENADKEFIAARIERLKQQLDDQTILRKAFDRRDAEVDKYVLSRLSDERGSQWKTFKDTWKRLTTERQEIDERLFLGREQINALHNAQPHV